MKIVDGVYLHVIETDKFKTNHVTVRFSGDGTKANRARRALVGQMLATATAAYPTSRLLRQRLAELYGASLSTSIHTKGLAHIIDLDLSVVANDFAINGEDLVAELLSLCYEVLFNPLRTVEQYQTGVFDVEQANLINYLESDREDVFYASDLELEQLYFTDERVKEPKYSTPERVAKENSYTAFQEFRRFLREDRIDIFFVGNLEEYKVFQAIQHFPFEARRGQLSYSYQQEFSNVTREKLDQRQANQSVLSLAYHVPTSYGQEDYLPLLVTNGLLGAFPHSLLFSELREKEGLAYTIASDLDPFRGVMKVQAGIDKGNRHRTLQLVTRQLNLLKSGRFSSDLMKKTKKMLLNGVLLSADNQKALIERAYNQAIFDQAATDLVSIQAGIEAVTKKDIIRLANQLRLQAVYFMEGQQS